MKNSVLIVLYNNDFVVNCFEILLIFFFRLFSDMSDGNQPMRLYPTGSPEAKAEYAAACAEAAAERRREAARRAEEERRRFAEWQREERARQARDEAARNNYKNPYQ